MWLMNDVIILSIDFKRDTHEVDSDDIHRFVWQSWLHVVFSILEQFFETLVSGFTI